MKGGWKLEVGISIPHCIFICPSSYQSIAFSPLNDDLQQRLSVHMRDQSREDLNAGIGFAFNACI